MSSRDDLETREKNIRIFVRILPLEKPCESCVRIDTDRKKIFVRCLQELQSNRIAVIKDPSYWCFRTDGIFLDASQEEVYRVSSKDLVSKVLNGTSCVLIGHGQTGSGKSFTLSGLRNNWEHRGLVSRILYDLFLERSNRRRTNKIQYHVSFVELHGKDARDLLLFETENRIRINDRDPFKRPSHLECKGLMLKDISVIYVDNEEQALRKIFEGETERSIVKGSTYPDSHLASAVITIHASNASLIASGCVVATAKMHIVEMAGIGSPKSGWKSAADVGAANLAKSQLQQFFSHFHGQSIPNAIRSSNLLKILGADFPVSSLIRWLIKR
nr:kinesin-like protein KIF9 [Nomia melanderi]